MLWFRVNTLGFEGWGVGCRVQGEECKVYASGMKDWRIRCKGYGSKIRDHRSGYELGNGDQGKGSDSGTEIRDQGTIYELGIKNQSNIQGQGC